MEKKLYITYLFGVICIIAGLALNHLKIGGNLFSFATTGNFLIYAGFVSLFIGAIKAFTKRKRLVDERMMTAALQSGRVTIVAVILAGFILMIADSLKPISIPYSMFASYMVMFVIVVNLVSYNLLLRYKY